MVGTKLTNNSDETFALKLFGQSTFLCIPIFQRPYKWTRQNVERFIEDLLNAHDLDETHFMGAIIFSEEPTSPSDPSRYNIIDGQQRLTTIYLFMCAAVKIIATKLSEATAHPYLTRYLVNTVNSDGSNIILQPGFTDRAQLNRVLGDIYKVPALQPLLVNNPLNKLSAPQASKPNGKMWDNYKILEKELRLVGEKQGWHTVKDLLDTALSQLSLVQIVVNDPTSGPVIYDSLNSRQEAMTIGELVKNGIFSKASAKSADEISRLEEHHWRPFFNRFTHSNVSYFDRYFFPFGLTKNPNLKKQDTFSYLQKEWRKIPDPVAVID